MLCDAEFKQNLSHVTKVRNQDMNLMKQLFDGSLNPHIVLWYSIFQGWLSGKVVNEVLQQLDAVTSFIVDLINEDMKDQLSSIKKTKFTEQRVDAHLVRIFGKRRFRNKSEQPFPCYNSLGMLGENWRI